ncbi:hypothetical protein DPEC_G00358900 [Dallia pectoralis]|uniref:Uncharacterized protein n=1 Tax=Dallia pectoralis TaxID=75939 RepID=A0ACC2F0H6_DALPE|nr:hypothetical protein DPEC_G00358900 [Dallia pectoralis]
MNPKKDRKKDVCLKQGYKQQELNGNVVGIDSVRCYLYPRFGRDVSKLGDDTIRILAKMAGNGQEARGNQTGTLYHGASQRAAQSLPVRRDAAPHSHIADIIRTPPEKRPGSLAC